MDYVLVFIAGGALGYLGAWFQHNPTKWRELLALFKKKDAP